MSLEVLFAGREIDLNAMYEQMKRLMDAEGLPYTSRTHTYNSRLAQELGKWAESLPGGDAIHDALFKAYFVDGKNIGDVETLVGIAAAVGLPEVQARDVLEQRLYQAVIDSDWEKSRQYGVTGVPTFVAGGYGVVGAQSYETLVRLVQKASQQ
jgi:predicted DsbA family dithiol-disulfide isomerase